MKYPFTVKYNGIFYKTGEEVPVENEQTVEDTNDKVEEPTEEVTEEVQQPKTYTRTEINRMSTIDLQKLGNELGIKNANNTSGSQLKKLIPDKLGI